MMMQHMQRSQSVNMSSAQNNAVVLHQDFKLQKNRYIKNEDEDDSRSFFNTYRDKKESAVCTTNTISTAATSAQSYTVVSRSTTLDSSTSLEGGLMLELTNYSVEDSHDMNLQTKDINIENYNDFSDKLHRAAGDNKRSFDAVRNTLPPKSPRQTPSPFNMQLSMGRDASKNIMTDGRSKQRVMIYKSNSFSDSTCTSMSELSCALNSVSSKQDKPKTQSAFHRRLAATETYSSAQLRRTKDEKAAFTKTSSTRGPFYTKVNSSTSSVVSTSTPPSLRKSDLSKEGKKTSPTFHSRLASTETYSSAHFKPFTQSGGTKGEKAALSKQRNGSRSRPAFAASNPTVNRQKARGIPSSLSRRQPSPLLKRMIAHTEKSTNQHTSRPLPRSPKTASRQQHQPSVYDRLAKTGTVSSLYANRKSTSYKRPEKTFGECSKTSLMREFKGSTYVSCGKTYISKSIIGSVIICKTKNL